MSHQTSPTNLAGRMGRWSAGHRKTAIFGWLAFVTLAVLVGMIVGTETLAAGKAGFHFWTGSTTKRAISSLGSCHLGSSIEAWR